MIDKKINLDSLVSESEKSTEENYEIPKINKKSKYINTFQTYLTDNEKKVLELFCKKNNLKPSAGIREIIRNFLKIKD